MWAIFKTYIVWGGVLYIVERFKETSVWIPALLFRPWSRSELSLFPHLLKQECYCKNNVRSVGSLKGTVNIWEILIFLSTVRNVCPLCAVPESELTARLPGALRGSVVDIQHPLRQTICTGSAVHARVHVWQFICVLAQCSHWSPIQSVISGVINCSEDRICLQPLAQPPRDKRHWVHINPVAGGETCEKAHSSRYHAAGIYRWLRFLQLLRWLLLWSCQLNDMFFRNRKHAFDSFRPAFQRALPLINAV